MERFGKYFSGKNILILGMGQEGKSSYDFINNNFPETSLTVYDKNISQIPRNSRSLNGSTDDIEGEFDLILKSPGIPLSEDFKHRYRNIISSQTDIFLREFSEQTIGITGTKGKSTTTSMLYNILNADGRHVIIAGNGWIPLFDVINDIGKDTVVTAELSAHQLQFIKSAPHISAILNVYPEHLDFYRSFIEYRAAKMNIVRFQKSNDLIIFPVKEFAGLERSSVSVPFEVIVDGNNAIVYYSGSSIQISIELLELKGIHNLYNIGTALIAAELAGCSPSKGLEAVYSFKGLPHRMEFVGKFSDIEFYNDSISTIPQSAVAAIKSFGNKIGTLILGGFSRGGDITFTELADEIKRSRISNIILLPETGRYIFSELIEQGFEKIVLKDRCMIRYKNKSTDVFFCDTFEEMIPVLFEVTPKGSVCLLSPASASYNMFRNFEERGDRFKELITKYSGTEDGK